MPVRVLPLGSSESNLQEHRRVGGRRSCGFQDHHKTPTRRANSDRRSVTRATVCAVPTIVPTAAGRGTPVPHPSIRDHHTTKADVSTMPDVGSAENAPETFRRAVEALRQPPATRPEITVREIPSPQRLAPSAAAVSATVTVHDPEYTRDWPGPFRVVCQANSELESEIATDPLLGPVAWSWLTDALSSYEADHHTLSGTVTRATTEGFGTKADEGASTEVEMR